jgi:predicted small integral membrane protein
MICEVEQVTFDDNPMDSASPSRETHMLTRIAKTAMVAAMAAIISLVAFGNVTDYAVNFEFVRHVMSMDSIFPNSAITYRAIKDPAIHHAAYACIIAAETTTAVLCWTGAALLLRRLRSDARAFNRAKELGVAGLALGFMIFQVGFMTIGGEWFGMWMSHEWNGQPSAFRYAMTIVVVLLFLVMPDSNLDTRPGSP